jgi:hypothetical protein
MGLACVSSTNARPYTFWMPTRGIRLSLAEWETYILTTQIYEIAFSRDVHTKAAHAWLLFRRRSLADKSRLLPDFICRDIHQQLNA